ncbi:MAG: hypothetical protein NVV73_21590 [Cellvibrionaceae bacterium]|nr:hypothetical protein [Cellvibrionaceae bacterium]
MCWSPTRKTPIPPQDRERLETYCRTFLAEKPLAYCRWGNLDPALLDRENRWQSENSAFSAASPFTVELAESLPACGYIYKGREADGYFSSGWIFSADFIFDYSKIFALLSGADAERLKAVFITDQGVFGFNKSGAVLNEFELDDAIDSRIELIAEQKIDSDAWQNLILASVQTAS